LLLVGDGPLRADLVQCASADTRIRFAPFHNQLEIPRVFAAADCLVLPSEGHGETWGLIVNEAMASERPCIVSDHVGCRDDLIDDERTGWSFPHGNVEALAACLRRARGALMSRGALIRRDVRLKIEDYNYAAAFDGLRTALAATSPAFKE
jgi:glycosyltransferase involved in cell wall biosynthesis